MVEGGIEVQPFMMNILAKRLEAINRESTNTLLRTSRSAVINQGRDFSCSICTGDGRLLFVTEGLPVHIANSDLVVQNLLELFKGDIHEGDAFLCNSPYYGNVHHSDHTIIVPVFCNGEIAFFTVARAHQADCGNSQPTSYMIFAKDVYEEGALDFPGVRIQRNYEDIKDIIRMIKMRIRVPEQWYGDYLAAIGATRIGERRLKEFCNKYGLELIKAFIKQYMEYGEACAIAEIKKLPKGTWEYETRHDPVPRVLPDGVPVKLKMTIDPDAGYITLDVTDNIDTVPCGLNMCRATVRASATQGVLSNLDPEMPHNDGTFKRFPIKMREDCVIGITKFPASASVATTDCADRLVNASQAIFAQLGPELGKAEDGGGEGAGVAMASGHDWRRGGAPYMDVVGWAVSGGGAVYGYDGWLTNVLPVAAGICGIESVELSEQRKPILIKARGVVQDSGGPGRWRGGLACYVELVQRGNKPGTLVYLNDFHFFPAKGIHGGLPGGAEDVWKYDIETGERKDLPQVSEETLIPYKEVFVGIGSGGGGFGDPLDREPDKVRWDAREELISLDAARNIYGVVLDTEPEQYRVDYEATEKLRQELGKKKEGEK